MTDRFEDAVREAARGLGHSSTELPTYHDAWQRGRRRRVVKRSALAVAGALVFVAAIGVNTGRFPGSNTTEVDDVAVAVPASTPQFEPTPVATTPPVDQPDTSTSPPPLVTIPTVPAPTPTGTSEAESATSAVESPTVAPTPPPVATATPAPVAEPTVAATAEPTAIPDPTASPVEPQPTVAAQDSAQPTAEPEQADPAATSPTDEPPGSEAPPGEPQLAFTTSGRGQPASAIVLADGDTVGASSPCDLDSDGTAEGRCELLPDYACTDSTEARPGYEAIDSDGDGVVDLCSAIEVTFCDTTGDGLGDTACIIEFVDPEPIDSAPAEGEPGESGE